MQFLFSVPGIMQHNIITATVKVNGKFAVKKECPTKFK